LTRVGSIDSLLKRIRKTGTIARLPGNGRLRSVRSDENIDKVEDLVLSQDYKPKTHRLARKISHETGIPRPRLDRIIHRVATC